MKQSVVLLPLLGLLTGCFSTMTRQEQLTVYRSRCLEYGYQPGTPEFANCMKEQEARDEELAVKRRKAAALEERNRIERQKISAPANDRAKKKQAHPPHKKEKKREADDPNEQLIQLFQALADAVAPDETPQIQPPVRTHTPRPAVAAPHRQQDDRRAPQPIVVTPPTHRVVNQRIPEPVVIMPPAVDNRIPNPPEAPLEIYRDPNHRDPHPVAAPPPSYDELYPNGAPPAPAPQPVAIIPPAVPEEAYEVIQAPAPEGINPNVPPRAHDKNHIYLKKDDELSIREKNEINNKDQERISSAAPEKIIYKDDQEVCYKSEDSPKEDDEAVKNKNIKNNPSYYQNKNHNNDTYAPYDQNRKSTDDRKIGRNDPRPVMLSPK